MIGLKRQNSAFSRIRIERKTLFLAGGLAYGIFCLIAGLLLILIKDAPTRAQWLAQQAQAYEARNLPAQAQRALLDASHITPYDPDIWRKLAVNPASRQDDALMADKAHSIAAALDEREQPR